jgi:hypothetical protein
VRAVLAGIRDARRGRLGPRSAGGGAEPAHLSRRSGLPLFLFALALRLPLLTRHVLAEGDGVHYAMFARAILSGDTSGLANAYWSNLWPAVIAAVAWLTRLDVVTAGRVASLLAGAALAPATAALATRAFGKRTGILAGLLVAGHPWLVHFSTLLFTESLFALLLVLVLWAAVRATGAGGAAATGGFAGLALLTRPETNAVVAAVALAFLAEGWSKARRQAVRVASVFLLVVLSFALARALVIRGHGGPWDFGGTKATANLLWGLAGTDRERERVATALTEQDENALARDARDGSVVAFVLAHPGRVARHALGNGEALLASGLRVFPFVPPVVGRPSLLEGGWPRPLALWAVLLGAIAVLGMALSLKDGGPPRLLAAAGFLYAAGLALFTVHDRLVVALVPLFLCFLAHGLTVVARRLLPGRPWTNGSLVGGAAVLGLASLALLLRAPELDYAGDPVVQRETGEWLAARYPQDTVLMTAAPCVDFYFHDAAHPGRELSVPWADYPGVVAYARRQGVDVIAVPEWHLRATRHPASDTLLHPEACREDLRHVATLGREGERMYVYEVLPGPEAR